MLVVPFEGTDERFVVRFDPASGRIHLFESMRYKGVDSDDKTLWINEVLEWGEGRLQPTKASVTWYDDGRPWAVFDVEEVVYDVDVSEYIRASGP